MEQKSNNIENQKVFFFCVLIYNKLGDIMRKKIYIYAFVFFLIDLISKVLVTNIKIKTPYEVINNFFYIDIVSNEGAAFSLLPGGTILFVLIGLGVLIYIDRVIIKDVRYSIPVSLVIGGIVGNLFDRILYGEVLDFLSFKLGPFYFPVFNLADTFICIGVLLLIIEYYTRREKNGDKSRDE